MQSKRRERSRSPVRVENVGRRRDGKNQDVNGVSKLNDMQNVHQINPMMMANMYSQGNMMMAGGLYPNMMMPGTMIGGSMMHSTGMDMMQGTGMEMVPQTSIDISAMGSQSIASTGGTMDTSMMGGMMMDPSLMGMYQSTMNPDIAAMREKKEIVLKQCILIPPEGRTSQAPRKNRPPGCRTIFIGGLPDKIKESIVREIFESYGRIHTLRLSKKNFCHIRYEREECVDAAMLISGYRIKIISNSKEDDSSEDEKTRWLHVDYALSRDDQNDYERYQRMALRVQQEHMEQLNAQNEIVSRSMSVGSSYNRSPSPIRLQPYSNAAMIQLSEKIKNEELFASSLPVLLSWLERGECSKKNATQFYSMLQTTNSHIRRLFNEKMQSEEELHEFKEKVKNTIANVIEQLEQVGKVFVAASHQRVWDHFTKPQRKNIETWQKMTQEFNTLKEEFNEKFYNDDTDFNGLTSNKGADSDEIQQLKLENDSLRFQLEAYKNEIDVIKMDAEKEMEKFKAQFIARQALQGAIDNNPPRPTPAPEVKPPVPQPLPEDLDSKVHLKETVEAGCGEAKLIGVMSAFLQLFVEFTFREPGESVLVQIRVPFTCTEGLCIATFVHPQGASLDYVVSYVRALFPHVSQATVHHVLQRHQDVFSRTTTGVGANIEHRWSFIAFNKEENTK